MITRMMRIIRESGLRMVAIEAEEEEEEEEEDEEETRGGGGGGGGEEEGKWRTSEYASAISSSPFASTTLSTNS
jgi:hypothetical protein